MKIDEKVQTTIEQYFADENFNIGLFERIYEIDAYRKNISNRYAIVNDIEKKVADFYKGKFRSNHAY